MIMEHIRDANLGFKFTDEQVEVLNKIEDFLYSNDEVFVLSGYAGTGKTSIMKAVCYFLRERNKSFNLMAPTGRAALILKNKTGFEASTIHSRIYILDEINYKDNKKEIEDNKDDLEVSYVFPIKLNDQQKGDVCIVDEASMVSSVTNKNEFLKFGTGNLFNDMFTYCRSSLKPGLKLIFVGDPAQLLPVGDTKSAAFDFDFFRNKGFRVRGASLKMVMRQSAAGAILRNATNIRQLLKNDRNDRNSLVFDKSPGEVEDLTGWSVIDTFERLYKEDSEITIVCFSNKKAATFNRFIRERLFGTTCLPCKGDRLMVVMNNYNKGLFNGQFVFIENLDDNVIEKRVPVYHGSGKERKKIIISLHFRKVALRANGYSLSTYIIEDLLNSFSPALNFLQVKALYILFCMEHSTLKPGSKEFNNALLCDPFFNAVQVKYGYAITCHKSQGGEWKNLIVDYTGRVGLSDDALRWCYTATTRCSDNLYCICAPDIRPVNVKSVLDAVVVKKMPEACLSFGQIPATPYHNMDTKPFLRAKYFEIVDKLEYSLQCCRGHFLSLPRGI